MINFVEGILVEGGTEAVVAVGGAFGLDVQLSAHGAAQLPPAGRSVRLWTHLSVREDSWSLFGFVDEAERAMFRLLISVAGVGPKVALGMLSGARASEIALFLRTGDEKALAGLPGIGKKSAARLVVELGNRVPESQGAAGAAGSPAPAEGPQADAAAALGAMGLSPAVAEQALARARRNDAAVAEDVEAWVKAALRNL
jgi:Holliday junction DNA helicase RuvA